MKKEEELKQQEPKETENCSVSRSFCIFPGMKISEVNKVEQLGRETEKKSLTYMETQFIT